MSLKIFFRVFILSTITSNVYSQIILKGRILDEHSKQPIPFANIGIFKANVGTVSNPDGSFSLRVPASHLQDSITFSSLGFKRVDLFIPSLQKTEDLVIELTEKPQLLREVYVVGKKVKAKTFSLGNTSWKGGVMETDTLYSGQSIALLIENKAPKPEQEFPLYIKSARIRILRSNLALTRFRLRVNEMDEQTGLPGNDLLQQSLIVESKLRSGWLEFDLSSQALVVTKPFFITFEQLTTREDRTAIVNGYHRFMKVHPSLVRYDTVMFEGKKQVVQVFKRKGIDLPGTYISIAPLWQKFSCYVRETSLGEWKKVRGIVTATATLSTRPPGKGKK